MAPAVASPGSSSPGDARKDIDELLEAGDLIAARLASERYWRANPNASAARFLSTRRERLWPAERIIDHRLAVLRSFTVEPVATLLETEAALAGCRLATLIGEFGAYGQDILDPSSGLYRHDPHTIFVALQTRDLTPGLWRDFASLSNEAVAAEIEAVVDRLAGLVGSLRTRTSANIVVHNLEPPLHLSEGLLDARRPIGQAEAVGLINKGLAARFAELPNVHLFDFAGLQAVYGRERFVSEKKWASAKLPLSVEAIGWLAEAWWRQLAVFALPKAKVLALDLDNTLWGGTVGEDGLVGIELGEEYPGVFYKRLQQAVLDISRRGVLIALVSKNNLADALEVIDAHPEMLIRRQHVAAMRVDWESKAQNLVAIAQELNLGLDSFVFLDDNPVERDLVRRSLPEVIVPEVPADPAAYADVLRRLPQLERLEASAEDAERIRYYADERQRRDLMTQVESLEDFLASLRITIDIRPIDAMSAPRAAQLTQKTNQLNTTTRRYTEAQLAERLSGAGWAGYTLRASDRFGDNGIVGVALAHTAGEVCEIDSFLLSCRVIGRRIETAFLAFLADQARSAGATWLQGWFLPTAKNGPAREIFRDAGLQCVETSPDGERWAIALESEAITPPPWIRSVVRASDRGAN